MADRLADVFDVEPADAFRPEPGPAARLLPGPLGAAVEAFDHHVDQAFEVLRGNHLADRLFYGASAVGDFSLIWHLAATLRALGGAEREALRLAVSLAAEAAVINLGVKSLFRRTRPVPVAHATRRLRTPRSSSFPSGHATSGFMAATLLSAGRPRSRLRWYALAGVVASSRVHVKIHHGSDVAAGALIGVALGSAVRKIWRL